MWSSTQVEIWVYVLGDVLTPEQEEACVQRLAEGLYRLFTTHYSLPTTHYPLLTTHFSLLTSHYPLLTTHYSLGAA